jgi:hypothetical protein
VHVIGCPQYPAGWGASMPHHLCTDHLASDTMVGTNPGWFRNNFVERRVRNRFMTVS